MTKKRQLIQEIFIRSATPLNAQQVFDETGGLLDRATVYRGLKYLEELRQISSFIFDCDERGVERYYCGIGKEHQHFMHCQRCHAFYPVKDCPLGKGLEIIEKETGFKVKQHFITLKGICRDCR
ncbi:Fur family transcriptional regulator [Oceanispirochaeta sp.]|jgi:Fur family ferric uptake transcriptional regulator|uniref:Fur family transcriptional regulator n=1 Tax=Oceanispirochaeta sp. TaxID=2035350 RepID=UPI00261E1271|nr:transcriptional repressor [Oceanispirochaeta sp.]MDA3957846.1 transcriptional repressor [Oceanispirochaeta sp.]